MNEIEKLYESAGILKECLSPCYINKTWRKTHDCPNCDNRENYPPFTSEKQLILTKWLIQNKRLCIHKAEHSDNFYMDTATTRLNGVDNSSFEECLASMLNLIWQDLTEEEQEQIRRILNE